MLGIASGPDGYNSKPLTRQQDQALLSFVSSNVSVCSSLFLFLRSSFGASLQMMSTTDNEPSQSNKFWVSSVTSSRSHLVPAPTLKDVFLLIVRSLQSASYSLNSSTPTSMEPALSSIHPCPFARSCSPAPFVTRSPLDTSFEPTRTKSVLFGSRRWRGCLNWTQGASP